MKVYIEKYKTISVLDSSSDGILKHINDGTKTLIEPDYKEVIPSNLLRRMSKVIRMGVACGAGIGHNIEAQGIILGSGVGCYNNSITFTTHYLTKAEGALSPTAFIQSTDNAIAGQLAIALGNHSYNNTYIQKGVAFESALIDAFLLVKEGKKNVLVGGVDVNINGYEQEADAPEWVGEGASFFLLSERTEASVAELCSCWVLDSDPNSIEDDILEYLKQNDLAIPDLVLYGHSFIGQTESNLNRISDNPIRYDKLSGIYFTNAAFAMQLGIELLQQPENNLFSGVSVNTILIVNNFNDDQYGLIYLASKDDGKVF